MMLTNRQIRIRLFESLKNSFFRKTVGISFALLFVLLVTAFSVIVVRFEYKLQLDKQKTLIVEDTKLDEEWSQIVLEYSSLATPTAVEKFAEKEKMSLPTKKDLRFLNKQSEGTDDE
ncbi:cell division protein FtsL [Candidatus Francisella endociliophora]|uniref:Cell division protein FtsL n=1 Tax=Candidatus Francisella endociliophora TaxID=653937 RepID=A0A097ENI7_9GAMM|nr:cell division protein FtsL [Francisella sp. FSC1006]AIT09128.1 cell division protein FtsL [Francisella sp. FSC1006]